MSSMTGNKIKISVFGQSHSAGIGVVIDGLPAGKKIDMEKIMAFMERRAPGRNSLSTGRKEADAPEIISGLVNDVTCGAPLCAIIKNTNQHSADYNNIMDTPRPSHADFSGNIRYNGFNDVSGGGHFSGRLTAPLCFAGAVCMQFLDDMGVCIQAHIQKIRNIYDDKIDFVNIGEWNTASKDFPVINDKKGALMIAEIEKAREMGDSVGGVIECAIYNAPAGIGSPFFGSVESRLSELLYSIPAVKGVEFGCGFDITKLRGSCANDMYITDGEKIKTLSNNNGGILGGITTGMPVVFRVAIKPTPSIFKPQQTVNLETMENEELVLKGRHDACIVPRAVAVVESCAALCFLDMLLD